MVYFCLEVFSIIFWLIFGMFKNDDSKKLFIIGIFFGISKLNNLYDYLRNFI